MVWIALIAFCIGFSIASDKFFQISNLVAIFRDASILGIISCGLTFVIISGEVDLSVGSLLGIVGLAMSLLMLKGWEGFGSILIVLIPMCVGVGVCFFNSILITKLRIPALIATLAMMMSLKGVKLVIFGGQDILIYSLPHWLHYISKEFVGPIPVSVLLFIGIIILASIILYKIPFGRRVYAVGADSHVAYLMGINTSRVKTITFAFLGFLVFLSSSLVTGRVGGYSISIGQDYEMKVLLAVVVGGTPLAGGRGTIIGSIGGVLLMATLANGFVLSGVPYSSQRVVLGLIFISVVALDSYYRRRKR